MAVTESRPFRMPSGSSVSTELELVSPRTDLDRLGEVWTSHDDVVLRGVAKLSETFWAETTISPDEDVWLVGVAACAPARTRWREQSRFEQMDGVWTAEVELAVDGGEIAAELTVDLWVVGPGRTASVRSDQAVHHGAKLWQLPRPVSLSLEREGADFPTSAVSFAATGRRAVPWTVEVLPESEPHWSISSSIRLYVNTDLDVCHRIVDGSAGEDVYAAVGCDIHLAVLHQIGRWRDAVTGDRLESIADEDYGSMAALGISIASTLGVPLDEGCRLAVEDPLTLASRSREALDYYRRAGAG